MERTTDDNREDIHSLRNELREANIELGKAVKAYAQANAAYRLAKSKAFLTATGTVAEKQAHVDGRCNELLFERDLRLGMKEAQMELVRSLRAELSAAQTESNSLNTELQFSQTMVPLEPVIEHLEKLAARRERRELGPASNSTGNAWHCPDPNCTEPTEIQADHHACTPW